MSILTSELQEFYKSDIGIITQNVLQNHINAFWQLNHGLRILGCGYATPYLDPYLYKSERVISMIPRGQGCVVYPEDSNNIVFSSDTDRMPIESSSIDRIIIIHHLEHCRDLRATIRELWRVLKASGRLLVIAPNRTGMWARADISPFAHGMPFTTSQLCAHFKDNLLVPEKHIGALFVPPFPNSPIMMRSANMIEKMGGRIIPFVAGVHILEVSKQIYASVNNGGTGSAVFAKTKEILQGKGMPVPQGFGPINDSKAQD